VISERWIVAFLRAVGSCGNPDGRVFHFGLSSLSLSPPLLEDMFIRAAEHASVHKMCFYLPRVVEEERIYVRGSINVSGRDIPSARYFSARDKRAKRDCHCVASQRAAPANLIIRKSSPPPRKRETVIEEEEEEEERYWAFLKVKRRVFLISSHTIIIILRSIRKIH